MTEPLTSIPVAPGVRVRLIADWKKAWTFWSVRLGLAGFTIQTALLSIPDLSLGIWNTLPDGLKTWVPEHFINWVPLSLFGAGQVARIVKQKHGNS